VSEYQIYGEEILKPKIANTTLYGQWEYGWMMLLL